jgi:hypothetical protein
LPASRLLTLAGSAVLLGVSIWLSSLFTTQAALLGTFPLWQRSALGVAAAILLWGGGVGLLPTHWRKPLRTFPILALLVAVPLGYFHVLLPGRASGGVDGRQQASALITESTSNGIIEVGFAYPIYTPTIEVSNHGLFTGHYEVYLRMIDANGDESLFRAVRRELPDRRLSVEAAVQGLLSETRGYLFNPVTVAPGATVTGRVVFIISNLRDGTTFTDALGYAYPGQFEIRQPDSGELLASFPLNRI